MPRQKELIRITPETDLVILDPFLIETWVNNHRPISGVTSFEDEDLWQNVFAYLKNTTRFEIKYTRAIAGTGNFEVGH